MIRTDIVAANAEIDRLTQELADRTNDWSAALTDLDATLQLVDQLKHAVLDSQTEIQQLRAKLATWGSL